MKDRTFQEWVHYFITLDLMLLTGLFMFVPVYPWWFFAILTFLAGVVYPNMKGKSGGSKKRSNFNSFK